MLHRLVIAAVLMGVTLALAGCVPNSTKSSNSVIDPRPVALRLEELPVGFVTREALFTTGRQYTERFQLAELRTQEESGGLSELWLEITSQPALADAQNAVTVFRDEDAAKLLVSDFIRQRNRSSENIDVEALDGPTDFPVTGVDEYAVYRAKWHDVDGYWAVYTVRLRVLNMTATIHAVTRTDKEGVIDAAAKATARALVEVQARKMKNAQD